MFRVQQTASHTKDQSREDGGSKEGHGRSSTFGTVHQTGDRISRNMGQRMVFYGFGKVSDDYFNIFISLDGLGLNNPSPSL